MLATKQFLRALSNAPRHFICLSLAATVLATSATFARAAEAGTTQFYPDWPIAQFQDLRNRASELALRAIGMIGINYKHGGNSPETGLDCSGLVRYVFKEAWGTSLPRTAEEISQVGNTVDSHDMQPGDLVFYNTLKRGFSHVGIYLGDNKFIHSPSSGGQVRIESMDLSYWKNRFNGARRIDQP